MDLKAPPLQVTCSKVDPRSNASFFPTFTDVQTRLSFLRLQTLFKCIFLSYVCRRSYAFFVSSNVYSSHTLPVSYLTRKLYQEHTLMCAGMHAWPAQTDVELILSHIYTRKCTYTCTYTCICMHKHYFLVLWTDSCTPPRTCCMLEAALYLYTALD